ncbi:MAG: DDE-type integrase/transposase/recombinase, partial [Promethearchaeota archaeon]
MTYKPKKTISEIKQDVFHFYYHKKLTISEIALNVKKSTRTIYRWIHEREKPSTSCQHDQSIRCHSQKKYSQEVLNRIIELKKENPKRSARIIREYLMREDINPIPSESTIRRYLMINGLGKIASESRQGYIVFEREKPNELWQIDIAGVQSVGHLGKIYLFALLDDCSRFIPAAFYASDQKGSHVIRLLQEAITTYGRPLQILADNGTQFKNIMGDLGSKYERVLHLLDIKPIFARVRHPQTKGKLERFFGSVNSMFLSEARFQVKQNKSMTLTEFNSLFQEWLQFYNTKHRHRSLPKRCSPSKVYLGKSNRIYRPLEIEVDWNRWCKKLETRRVSKT